MNDLNITINFDMDGTIADLYGVNNWLDMIINQDETPYTIAKPLLKLNVLARYLNKLQQKGYQLGVISWLAKNSNTEYNEKVTQAKIQWLKNHLPSVKWDIINIVEYGTPKQNFCNTPLDILFDDEMPNRNQWNGIAYDVNNIIEILKTF